MGVNRAAIVREAALRLVERLAKATAREAWREIHAAADAAVPQWVAAYLTTIRATGIDKAALATALEAGDVAGAVAAVEWHTMDAALAQQYYRQITDLALSGAKVAAGDLGLRVDWVEPPTSGGGTGRTPPRRLPPAGGEANFDLRFDLTNPKSFDAIQSHTADLVREVSYESKQAIKGLVDNAFRQGVPPAKLGRQIREQIREHIGLTIKQSIAVGNYRGFLERLAERDDLTDLGRGPRARMARGLRSARSVPPIMRQGLDADKIDKMTTAYRDRLLRERAENIARTETMRAANEGQRLLWEDAVSQGQLDTARMQRVWIITPDDRLCELCEQMVGDRAIAEIGEAFRFPGEDVMSPPGHPRCLPGHSRVSATGIQAASKRWYEGELVVIRTASGKELSCTPNHPILTPHGWVAAGLLNEGGQVVASGTLQWISGGDDDNRDVPPRIEEIAETFGSAIHVTAAEVPVAAPDFHGDGAGSEVAVVWADRLLWHGDYSALNQKVADGHLIGGVAGAAGGNGSSDLDPVRFGDGAPFCGAVSGSGLHIALGGGHLGPLQGFGFTLSSGRNASLQQPSSDAVAINAIGDRKSQLGFTGHVSRGDFIDGKNFALRTPNTGIAQEFADSLMANPQLLGQGADSGPIGIFADHVVGVDRSMYRGHVFNLQTNSEMYVSEGIITHNCRCSHGLERKEAA